MYDTSTEDQRQGNGRRAEDQSPDALDRAAYAVFDAQVEMVRGWQALTASVGIAILAGITVILWVLALASYRLYGFVLDKRSYSVSTTVTAVATTVVFLIALIVFIRKMRKGT